MQQKIIVTESELRTPQELRMNGKSWQYNAKKIALDRGRAFVLLGNDNLRMFWKDTLGNVRTRTYKPGRYHIARPYFALIGRPTMTFVTEKAFFMCENIPCVKGIHAGAQTTARFEDVIFYNQP